MSEWVEQVRAAAMAALPPVEGELEVSGLSGPVEVLRDRWGVPHVVAPTVEDAYLAQGFVQASERLFQIDAALRLAGGRLATMFGDPVLPMDRFARTVGWNRAGRRVAEAYDDLSHRMMRSFIAGAHAWLERMPAAPVEYAVLGLEPELPADEASWAAATVYLAWSLSGNWDDELLRAELAETLGWDVVRDLFPGTPPAPGSLPAGTLPVSPTAAELLDGVPPRPRGLGSNAWVVGPSRTGTGSPLLANDPHLVSQMPSVWIEVHLSAPGLDVSGVALPFSPGVIIGRSPRHAWGLTNVGGDTQDLYVERLSDDGSAAWYDGAWEPVTVREERIEVRGRDEPEILRVRETRHGPILDAYLVGVRQPRVIEGGLRHAYALRWVGLEHAVEPSTVHRMATAGSFAAFREAVRTWACPGQNIVYADADGTIGYQCTGRYPVRRASDGTLPVPGWDPAFEWDGCVAFDELPWAQDPPDGVLVTANDRPYADGFPHDLGRDFSSPDRAVRIAERLAAEPVHTPETFAAIQLDTVSAVAARIAGLLAEVEPATERQRRALELLRGWDGDLAADSAAAALYEVWSIRIAHEVVLPRLGERLFEHYYARRQGPNAFQARVLEVLLRVPSERWFGGPGRAARDEVLRRALDAALDELTEALGDDPAAWRWGALHRVVPAGPLAMIEDLAPMFTGGVVELGGDGTTVLQGAFEPGGPYDVVVLPSWRMIADPADPDGALGVHTTGQSGHPASPHWNDLLPLWAAGSHHPLPMSGPAVRAAAGSVLRLAPAER
ncbi:MAG: penicillin acylase family protein [Candidatus Velamenicoccus archaeovorus]